MEFFAFLAAALLVEAVWQAAKPAFPPVPAWADVVVTLGLGVAVCVLAGLDLFAAAGVQLAASYVGQVLSGLLVGRGSNFLHDLLTGLYSLRRGE
jgi:hypothetical protein